MTDKLSYKLAEMNNKNLECGPCSSDPIALSFDSLFGFYFNP